MRRDFQKVIVERPRRGGSWIRKQARLKRLAVSLAQDEFADGGGVARGRRDKEFTDLLNPLRRFLDKNVGRPWNKVYSEICEVADRRSLAGWHLLDHAKYYVAQNCWFENGKVLTISRWGGVTEVWQFYVHPKTGILTRMRRKK